MIERALDDMKSHPARLMYGHGASALGFNRRGGDPIATYDQRTDVLQVIDTHEHTLAVLFFHGCHPVQMYRTKQIISADYPAVARAEVEAWLKATGSPNAMAIFFQGFGGNIDPSPGIWRGDLTEAQYFDANGQLLTEGQPDGQQQFREEEVPLTNLTQGAYYVLRVSRLPKNMQALETQDDTVENISTFFISVRTQ